MKEALDDDIHDAEYVLYYAENLVYQNIKLPSRDKILSISDKDAAYIVKGQRNPVIGYKPQIARRRRHTRSSSVTGVQTCALPIL